MRAIVAIILAALVVGGCAGGGAAEIERSALRTLVLQSADLPKVFERFDEGAQIAADTPSGARSDPGRFGRTGGWKARYRRPGTQSTRGPLVIESRVELFDSDDGAAEELQAFRRDALDTGWRTVSAQGVGAESVALELAQGAGAFATRFFWIGWRHRNAGASLLVQGFEDRIVVADALELARRQQRRLAAATAE